MNRTPPLAHQLSTTFTSTSAPPGLLGGTFRALDNAPTRSIHIKIHPRPRSLNESQQILNLLRKYGEVEVFRHLKYDFAAPAPNTLIVVYKHATSATKAIAENKIAFTYASSSPAPSSADDVVYSHSAPFPRPAEMVIRPAHLLHLSYIQRQRYYWAVGQKSTGRPGLEVLGPSLPVGLRGLREFDVMAPETRFREREIQSRVFDEKVRKRGWERLGDLWEMGRRRREDRGREEGSGDT